MPHSRQADLDDPRQSRQGQRASGRDTPTEKVLMLIRLGRSAPQIRQDLGMSPSRLRRILQSRTFQDVLDLDRQVARLTALLAGVGRAKGVRNGVFRPPGDGRCPSTTVDSGLRRDSLG